MTSLWRSQWTTHMGEEPLTGRRRHGGYTLSPATDYSPHGWQTGLWLLLHHQKCHPAPGTCPRRTATRWALPPALSDSCPDPCQPRWQCSGFQLQGPHAPPPVLSSRKTTPRKHPRASWKREGVQQTHAVWRTLREVPPWPRHSSNSQELGTRCHELGGRHLLSVQGRQRAQKWNALLDSVLNGNSNTLGER